MPSIIAGCIRSQKKAARQANLEHIVVTSETINQYVSLPPFLLSRLSNGEISLTHFSDIVRMALLKEHGGLWLDATIFVAGPLDNEFIRSPFATFRIPPPDSRYRNPGLYFSAIFGANVSHCFFYEAMYKLLLKYWRRHNRLIDYHLMDYIFVFALENLSLFAEIVNSQQDYSSQLYDLAMLLNRRFDSRTYHEMSRVAIFQKLSYKHPLIECTLEGELTFYGKLFVAEFQ